MYKTLGFLRNVTNKFCPKFSCKLIEKNFINFGIYILFFLLFSSEANYKALYDYAPQQKDDLKLCEGDMVTLIETPAGDWWRGKVEDREGWFPKSYVECIDSIAQVKRRKEGMHVCEYNLIETNENGEKKALVFII